MIDVVDLEHLDRNCPYCGKLQYWSNVDSTYTHWHDMRVHCDEERLALWDLSESLKASS